MRPELAVPNLLSGTAVLDLRGYAPVISGVPSFGHLSSRPNAGQL